MVTTVCLKCANNTNTNIKSILYLKPNKRCWLPQSQKQQSNLRRREHVCSWISSSVTACFKQQSAQPLLLYLPCNPRQNHWSFHKVTGACDRANNEQSSLFTPPFFVRHRARQSATHSFPAILNYQWSSIGRQRSVYAVHNVCKHWMRALLFQAD